MSVCIPRQRRNREWVFVFLDKRVIENGCCTPSQGSNREWVFVLLARGVIENG